MRIFSPFSPFFGTVENPSTSPASNRLATFFLIVYSLFALIGVASVSKALYDYKFQSKPKEKYPADAKKADEVALEQYFSLLKRQPELERTGPLNDHTKGAYEIIYQKDRIAAIQEKTYLKMREKGHSPEVASERSRIGLLLEDDYVFFIRDAVQNPQGIEHTYIRIVQKRRPSGAIGAVVLPIKIEKDGTTKITLVLSHRHATGTFELELARGGAKGNETSLEAAKRELREETGIELQEDPTLLIMTMPDSGLMASEIPIYAGVVKSEGNAELDETEAIAGRYTFTLDEIEEGLKKGFIDVRLQDGTIVHANIRDHFLISALKMAKLRGLIEVRKKELLFI